MSGEQWKRLCSDAACIEWTDNGFGGVAIRSSTRPDRVLEVSGDEWRAFMAAITRQALNDAADEAAKSDWSWKRIDAQAWLRRRASRLAPDTTGEQT